jgi:hypothetical protein
MIAMEIDSVSGDKVVLKGTAKPGEVVILRKSVDGQEPVVIGIITADSDGRWILNDVPLSLVS